jgi:hypothetical protein
MFFIKRVGEGENRVGNIDSAVELALFSDKLK